MGFSASVVIMAFTQPRATIDHLFPSMQKSSMCDVQGLGTEGKQRDRVAKKPSVFAKFESKLGGIHVSLKRRKHERNCLQKTQHGAGEPTQHVEAERSITHTRIIEYREMDLGKPVQVVELDHHNEEEDDGHPQAIRYPNTLTATRHSQVENIFTGTAIESSDTYDRMARVLGGDKITYPPPPARHPPPVPTRVIGAEQEATMANELDKDLRPQTRSTQRSSSDESLGLLHTRSAQSVAGGHSRKTSSDTTATSLYSIEECTEYTDTSGMDKAVEGKAEHQPDLGHQPAAAEQQAGAYRRWDQDSLEATGNNETSSDEESMDEAPTPRRKGGGLPPRMQEEIKKSLALVNSLMAYKLEDDPEMMEALKGRLGTAVDLGQSVSMESPKRFADIDSLRRRTPGLGEHMGFESFVNQEDRDGGFDGDVHIPVSPSRQAGSPVAQALERRGEKAGDASGSGSGLPWVTEPTDLLLHYQEIKNEDSDWEIEEETSSSIHSPYQQTYSPDPYYCGTWATQLYQIDEEPGEDECDGEPSPPPGKLDGDSHVDDLRGLIKIEGSLDVIKSHVCNFVNEEFEFRC
ncbi:hypothetical protein VSDG_08515 [Cytospora chrysosperma]|uniref:Uncharacterized protein n=1 Tax=Cytospora chrysosperma TaxID=252740 RepID=A0A423VET7_CYTCH|nr:hypothetical protein VSDG_08515 [Valsa sordida]